MDSKTVLAKLERKAELKRAKLKADIKTELKRAKRLKRRDERDRATRYAERMTGELGRVNRRTISGLTFGIKQNYFSNARGTTGFCPETLRAHSYSWYSLAQKIKGVLILNTYRYSSQTSIHIGRVGEVMRDLGLKYKTLDAPKGLQDLGKAVDYELTSLARSLVRQKYGRGNKHKPEYFVNRMLKYSNAHLNLLAKLGYKTNRKMRLAALQYAEQERLDRNERLRERGKLKRQAAAIVIVSDFDNKLHGANDGKHLIKSSDWAWDLDTKTVHDQSHRRGRSTFQWEREQAVRDGMTKIYVHRAEARHLSVVG